MVETCERCEQLRLAEVMFGPTEAHKSDVWRSMAKQFATENRHLRSRLRDAVIYAEQIDGSDRLRAWAKETRKLLAVEQAAERTDG